MKNLTFSGFQCPFSHPWVSILSQITTLGDHKPCIVKRNDRQLQRVYPIWRSSPISHLGTVVDAKIPTHVRFAKSNSRGLPAPPTLGQTIDRCINDRNDGLLLDLERFSNDCRKTKTKVITPTNHNRSSQRDEPITISGNYL